MTDKLPVTYWTTFPWKLFIQIYDQADPVEMNEFIPQIATYCVPIFLALSKNDCMERFMQSRMKACMLASFSTNYDFQAN